MLDGIHDENVRTAEDVELLAHIQRSISVRASGTLLDGQTFGGGSAAIELLNGSNLPAQFEVELGSSPELSVEPRTLKASVAAGATARLPIQLKPDRPRPGDVPLSVPFEWTARVEARGKRFERHEHSELSVYRGRKLAHQPTPVRVDGRLDEWQALAYDGRDSIVFNDDGSWQGYADLDYRFDVRVDEQHLYLAIDVTDDVIKVKREAEPFSQDGIEILIDPRDDPDRRDNTNPFADAWKRLAELSLSPAATPAEMAVSRAKLLPEGVRYVAAPTAKGYAAEVAIPHALLDAMRPHGPWQAIRLSLAIFDSDEDFGQGTGMRWQPEWRSKSNRPGSGTFYRQ
jgi:hypothetical protein